MHYFEFADKDTTLYENSSSLNAGLDEVLEIRKNVPASGANISVSRILISFDLNYISGSISSGLIPAVGPNPASSSFFLNLFGGSIIGSNDKTNVPQCIPITFLLFKLSAILSASSGFVW